MGIIGDGKSSMNEKSSSPVPEHTNIHVYPDWAAMQAYYGPRVPLPPYYNTAIPPGHAPHPYMWGPPQHMMPPFGPPYAAMYPHGGVYAHPGIPLAAHGHGAPSSPAVAEALAAVTVDSPAKSSGNTDRGLMKKLKSFDGLAMSIGNGSSENVKGMTDHALSQSSGTEGSSDGSDGNTQRMDHTRRKRSLEGTLIAGKDKKGDGRAIAAPTRGTYPASDKVTALTIVPANVTVSPSMTAALELMNPSSGGNAKSSSSGAPQACSMLPSDGWVVQDEREMKKEKRKQSNRESARRSRLRKQAESEELAVKVEALSAENKTLRSEMSRLTENAEKLRLENVKLLEKLKLARLGQTEGMSPNKAYVKQIQPINTENLLSKINNDVNEVYENNSNSTAKLHQLLDTNPRADAVAAG